MDRKTRRKLPNWLESVSNNENSSSTTSLEKENKSVSKKHKNNQKTVSSVDQNIETKSNESEENLNLKDNSSTSISQKYKTGRVLRSSGKLNNETSSENQNKPSHQYPFVEYKGDIKFLNNKIDISCACDELMIWVENQTEQIVPIAFDMEWYFSFQSGPMKTALIQLCAEENVCYLFHVFEFNKLPAALVELLKHKKVQLHGVNIKNDLRKLKRDFPEINIDNMIEQCLDLSTWCNFVCNTSHRWSMERLVIYICKLQISKNKKVRMSKWHILPLNDDQKLYAAIDVYISQVIHKELKKKLIEKEKCTKEFLNEFGKDALNVVKALGEDFI